MRPRKASRKDLGQLKSPTDLDIQSRNAPRKHDPCAPNKRQKISGGDRGFTSDSGYDEPIPLPMSFNSQGARRDPIDLTQIDDDDDDAFQVIKRPEIWGKPKGGPESARRLVSQQNNTGTGTRSKELGSVQSQVAVEGISGAEATQSPGQARFDKHWDTRSKNRGTLPGPTAPKDTETRRRDSAAIIEGWRQKSPLEAAPESISGSPSRRKLTASKPAGLEHVDEKYCKALEEALGWEQDTAAERGIRPYLNTLKRRGAKAVETFDQSTDEIDIKKPHLWAGGTSVDVTKYSLRDNIFNHMFTEDNVLSRIYGSENELRPLPEADTDKGEIPNLVKLIVAFSAPDPESPLVLIDLKSIPNLAVRVPQLLNEQTHRESAHPCAADINATTKYCCVDLHIDDGLCVFSECDAPKLWVFFPPTPENVDKYYNKYDQAHKLASLWNELDEPYFGLTLKNEAMFIPAGWIHATYSLENCMVVGTQWASSDYLDITTNVLLHDVSTQVNLNGIQVYVTTNKRGLTPLIRALYQAYQRYARHDEIDMIHACLESLRQICPKNMGDKHLSSLKEIDKTCPDCEQVAGAGLCDRCEDEKASLIDIATMVKGVRDELKRDLPSDELRCRNKGCKCKGILGHLPVFYTK